MENAKLYKKNTQEISHDNQHRSIKSLYVRKFNGKFKIEFCDEFQSIF